VRGRQQAVQFRRLTKSGGGGKGATVKTIIINPGEEPERYETFYEAMMSGTVVEGWHIMQYSEYDEAGELICKFMLRESNVFE